MRLGLESTIHDLNDLKSNGVMLESTINDLKAFKSCTRLD